MGKHISTAIAISTNKDPYNAAKEAAAKAIKSLGRKPTISFVFYAGDYDPYKLNEGAYSVLKGTEFVGGSADYVFHNDKITKNGVMVVSIGSEFLHVGVASMENASKKPYESGQAVIKDALKKVPVDKYVDPYLQFNRMKHTDISWMIKVPSFFVMLFTRGLKLNNMGDEYDILRGISDVIGLQVPIWGGSLGADAMKVLKGEPYEIYMFHNNKVYKDGIIALINISSLLYSYSMEHGCKPTKITGFVSKTKNNGFVVDEISNMPVVEWYAKNLGINTEEFVKNSRVLTQLHPLGIPDTLGNYMIRGGGIPFDKSLGYVAPLKEGWPVVLMEGSDKNLMDASEEIKKNLANYVGEGRKPSLAFVTQCVTREIVYGKNSKKELALLKKKLGCDIIGFTSFGETGSKQGQPANFCHVALNVFAMYDTLLSKV